MGYIFFLVLHTEFIYGELQKNILIFKTTETDLPIGTQSEGNDTGRTLTSI